jgi:hypothetical protein
MSSVLQPLEPPQQRKTDWRGHAERAVPSVPELRQKAAIPQKRLASERDLCSVVRLAHLQGNWGGMVIGR